MKRKKVLAGLLAVVGAVLLAASCSRAGAGVSALAVDTTVTLTTAQTVALFGQSIDCEYLSTDGTYKPITATYAGNVSITDGEYFSPDGQSFAGRSFIQYSLPYKSDMKLTPSDITIFFKTAVDLSGVGYVDTALVQLSNMDYGTQIYGTYTDYWYTSAGYFYPLRQDDTEPKYNLYGRVWNDPSYSYTITPAFYNGSVTSFSTGWAKCGSFKDTTYASDYYIGIVCPILSDSYVFDGNNGAGAGSGDSSGSGGDTSDLSAIISRLDTIIAQLDALNDDDESSGDGSSGDGSSSFDTPYDVPPPEFDAAAAWSAVDNAFQNPFDGSGSPEYDLGLDSPSGGGGSPPPVDESAPSEIDMGNGLAAVWFLISYIFGVFPWLQSLTTFSLSVGVAVFIIFRSRGGD